MRVFKLLIFIFGFCALSYAYPDIKIALEDSKSIMPSVYKLNIDINYSAKDSNSVIAYLGRIDNIIRGLNIPYKGGNFRILRNCFYNNKEYVCEGYKGINDYSFYMKNPRNQTKILNALKGINYQITYSGFTVPKKDIEATKNYLINDLAEKTLAYASNFSKIFKKECFVKSISYVENNPAVPMRFAMVKAAPMPAISKENISMRAFVDISCR
jgi:hypothetical protein